MDSMDVSRVTFYSDIPTSYNWTLFLILCDLIYKHILLILFVLAPAVARKDYFFG